jgi:hypothetical protein
MFNLPIRTNKHGVLMPLVHPLISKHRSYKIAVRTAHRRAEKLGHAFGIVTWHDENYVVMPPRLARAFEEEDLLVEYVG